MPPVNATVTVTESLGENVSLNFVVRYSGSIAITKPCPSGGGSPYRTNENLTDFPQDLRGVSCSTLNVDENYITTLENGLCVTCFFISANKNKVTVLTKKMLVGFPSLKHLSLNYNCIIRIEGDALKGLERVDLDFNPFDDFQWPYTVKGQKFSLDGVLIHCTCAMKDAVKRGVVILEKPRCIGHSEPYGVVLRKLQCPPTKPNHSMVATTEQPTTGMVC